ncbi:prepilin-type N-terminal cleavage/methylation domain-containing protein [Sinorhizobium meliloti]|uniref:prepilin-type N-terminal cleavage/methylation domain-containing protein n=1 Tax=Rhizobium meliloti TaxID=382 RepID=UPI001296EB83|nr:prepilin-type N-terminal cleavage/methylation domain-containing protein [Sinorhizobium meliloti]MQX42970.1 prepilin-type N-terminal cleavage/methylation domain-containing protein [Sinorhizobium meliloti]
MASIDDPGNVCSGATALPVSGLPSSASQCGYTLIEVLVVLAIASIMAVMMIGGVRQFQSLSQLGERLTRQSVADAVADRVADDLAGSLELPLLASGSGEQVSFLGAPHEVRFNAVVRTGFLTQTLREVAYSMETLGEQQTLVRISLPRRLGQVERTGAEKLVMHPDVNAVAFRYMTRDAAGGAVWLDHWNQARLPVAIRLQVDLGGTGSKQARASRTVNMLR